MYVSEPVPLEQSRISSQALQDGPGSTLHRLTAVALERDSDKWAHFPLRSSVIQLVPSLSDCKGNSPLNPVIHSGLLINLDLLFDPASFGFLNIIFPSPTFPIPLPFCPILPTLHEKTLISLAFKCSSKDPKEPVFPASFLKFHRDHWPTELRGSIIQVLADWLMYVVCENEDPSILQRIFRKELITVSVPNCCFGMWWLK